MASLNSTPPGVNVYGYLHAASGVGQHTRLLIRALESAKVPFGAQAYLRTTSPQTVPFRTPEIRTRFPISIVGVNADQTAAFFQDHDLPPDEYKVGLWAWETEDFPASMARHAALLDEIWANSGFSAAAISRKVDIPVFPFPLPIEEPAFTPLDRHELGLSEDFLFLFCFDFDSVFTRKNPIAVVRAFRSAFGTSNPRTQLLIKAINGDRHEDHRSRLVSEIEQTPGCHYLEENVSLEKQHGLIGLCDCYVSLHRSEGFGLTLAEAMALGKPVIATAYSGNLDYMDHGISELIGYRYTPVGPDGGPYAKTSRWAEPDINHASRAMRRIRDQPDYSRRLGALGRARVLAQHGLSARGQWIAQRLAQIQSGGSAA